MGEDIISRVQNELIRNGFDPDKSPWEHKVIMFVLAAQGIIDNGGFLYFFESKFQGDPSIDEFVDAFVQIGSIKCAEALEKAIDIDVAGSNEYGNLDNVFFQESDANYKKLEKYIGQCGFV